MAMMMVMMTMVVDDGCGNDDSDDNGVGKMGKVMVLTIVVGMVTTADDRWLW